MANHLYYGDNLPMLRERKSSTGKRMAHRHCDVSPEDARKVKDIARNIETIRNSL